MKNKFLYILCLLSHICVTGIHAQVPSPTSAQEIGVVLQGATAHLATGEVIEKSAIAFEDGKIVFVGTIEDCGAYESYKHIDVSGKHLYPGFILLASQVGLGEIGAVRASQDRIEVGTFNPSVRSIIAYNTDSEIIPVLRSNGITHAQVYPGGATISGSSSIVQFDAWNWEDAVVDADEGIWLNWPSMYTYSGHGNSRAMTKSERYTPTVQKIERLFQEAKVYKGTPMNSKLEAMKGLFDGSKTLYLTSNYPKSIIQSISLLKELGVKNIVLNNADEDALVVADFLKQNNISVILAHVHRTPKRKDSFTRKPFELAADFKNAGITASVTYAGASGSMNLPFVAGQCVAYGLSKEEALQTITLNAAKISGIDDQYGSIEVGKVANIVVSEGDILDIRTNKIVYSFISGRMIDLNNKHKKLYRKFSAKYGHEIVE